MSTLRDGWLTLWREAFPPPGRPSKRWFGFMLGFLTLNLLLDITIEILKALWKLLA